MKYYDVFFIVDSDRRKIVNRIDPDDDNIKNLEKYLYHELKWYRDNYPENNYEIVRSCRI